MKNARRLIVSSDNLDDGDDKNKKNKKNFGELLERTIKQGPR